MKVNDYCQKIMSALTGTADELASDTDRSDWGGSSLVLSIYTNARNEERTKVIKAMRQIINTQHDNVGVLAELVEMVDSLDIAELYSDIEKLQELPVGKIEPLKEVLENFDSWATHMHSTNS